jgi:hypothetical protein
MKGGATLPRKRARPSVPISQSEEQEPEFWETRDTEDHVTGGFGAIESLFTPEGIEWVEAMDHTTRGQCKRPRT